MPNMAGTIIITGANGSLAIPAVQHLLTKYPTYTALLTVRNTSDTDLNTKRLRETVMQHPQANWSIRKLDLADLSAVHDFADTVAAEITDGKLPPLASIVCNAYYWNLVDDAEVTVDRYEKTFQVNHLAHAALVLRLLGSFESSGGRVVLLSSDSHWPGKNSLEKYPPAIPDDLNLLVEPGNESSDKFGHGFQRYAISKLVIVMWMYALNNHLAKDPKLSNITAVVINPGNLSDSRALRTNTPWMLFFMSKLVIQPFRFLLRFIDPTMRLASQAGVDVIDLATNKAYPGDRGYFTLLKKDVSAPDSLNEETQQKLWVKSMEWDRINRKNTALTAAFE